MYGRKYGQESSDGGYGHDHVWSAQGRAWRDEEGLEAPKYWTRSGEGWSETRSLVLNENLSLEEAHSLLQRKVD